MKTQFDVLRGRARRFSACLIALAMPLALESYSAQAQTLIFDTELVSLNLSGGPFPIPLASDPGNALGDSVEGFGFVDSEVSITLSSQRSVSPGPPSLGEAHAFPRTQDGTAGGAAGGEPEPIDPSELDGQQFFVDSFFDVFFDITVTDVDPRPGRDYAGQPDGASFFLPDNGRANMQSFYGAIFDADAPNFGLIPPPEADPYIGHFLIEIPLGGDINGNGENDKIKFTLAAHSAGDENRTFIVLPDGTVLDEFDSAAFLEGAIVDESTDPPFTIGGVTPNGLPDPALFSGPTTASSLLLNPILGPCLPDEEPPEVICQPTTNPSGKNTPKAGANPKSGQNPDGFYELAAIDNCDANPGIFIVDNGSGTVFGPFANGDRIKITQAPGAPPKIKSMSGAISSHIIIQGDAEVIAVDLAGNQSLPVSCLVPPPAK